MSDRSDAGVLYTEHTGLTATMPVPSSLWSYQARARGSCRRSIARNPDGSYEYWLDRSDPLLNTILPDTGVSLVINFAELWSAGRSLVTSAWLPRVCVVGPVIQSRILQAGRFVRAVGAGFLSTLTPLLFGVPAAELVDRIVPLQDLARTSRPVGPETVGQTAPRLISLYAGRVSTGGIASSYGLSRHQFDRRFCAAAGLPPELFARITRFHALGRGLLHGRLAVGIAVLGRRLLTTSRT
jgi:hypothetical protein